MGLADMLIKLGITYGSNESLRLCDEIGKCMIDTAIKTSAFMAKENGRTFPMYNKDNLFKSKFFIENTTEETKKIVEKYGMYNSQLLTIAPTGSISTMIGISGGIEPIFAMYYTRKTESLDKNGDKYYKVYTKIAKDYMEENKIVDDKYLPEYFVVSSDIPYNNRIKMQSVWQKHIDASISSTVNLPEDTTIEDIAKLYESAYDNGLKGITVFRNNCKRAGVLSVDPPKKEEEFKISKKYGEFINGFPRGMIENVPDGLEYRKYKLKTGCGTLYLFVGYDEDEGRIYDIFTNTGSGGGCSINTQANSRLISACMRGGVPIEYIIEQLNKTDACPSFQFSRGKGAKLSPGKSCPSAIANVLRDLLKEIKTNQLESNKKIDESHNSEQTSKHLCPECGQDLRFEGGCVSCPNCGWSKCE